MSQGRHERKAENSTPIEPITPSETNKNHSPAHAALRLRAPIAFTLIATTIAVIALIIGIQTVFGIDAEQEDGSPSSSGKHLIFDVNDKMHPSGKDTEGSSDATAQPEKDHLQYRESIASAAEAYNLDPYLIAGVIQTESGFNPNLGNQYACGLMGVSDIGCEEMNLRGMVDPNEYPPGNIMDPDVNIRYGSAILRMFLDEYDGNLATVLAAYNAGPANAQRWVQAAGSTEIEGVIDIYETREYIKRVPQNVEKLKAEYPRAFE